MDKKCHSTAIAMNILVEGPIWDAGVIEVKFPQVFTYIFLHVIWLRLSPEISNSQTLLYE
jgi:hypothetical protein